MTRINVVPVEELCNKHLLAEWREIPRLIKNLHTSLNRKSKAFDMTEISSEYVLGKGHVKFFFNKFEFIRNRYEDLTAELLIRNFNINEEMAMSIYNEFANVPEMFYNDWKPSENAMKLNRDRIKERMPVKPKWSKIV